LVFVILGTLHFEAEKFETRTMPTPDLKGKEMIYWIRLRTLDRRLVSDLKRFLDGSGRYVDLRVPGAFIWVKTELEDARFAPDLGREGMERSRKVSQGLEEKVEQIYTAEIILRRMVSEYPRGQSPYG
jgi:hypothetical protein